MWKKILLGLLAAILLLAAGGYIYYRFFIFVPPPISDADRAAIDLLPLPAKLELQGDKINVKSLNINDQHEPVKGAVEVLINTLGVERSSDGLSVNLSYDTLIQTPYLKMNEDYSLTIDDDGIILQAPTSVGVLRGLETLKQLAEKRDDGIWFPHVTVEDHPRYAWRGLMIDVCRHWIPKDVVLENIDAMAAAKMNVLHLHLSEDQGFRVESKRFPLLHEVGSNGDYYTQDDIREIVSNAAAKGIRVIPEFDVPGHSKSWQIAYPELSSAGEPLQFGKQEGSLFGPPLDPTKENVYDFLDEFIDEMAGLFPDAYFHIGGDEVDPKFWEENPRIRKFMDSLGMESAHDLQAYFNGRLHTIVTGHGKVMIGWDEILNEDLSNDVVVQAWTGHKALFKAVQNGGKGILSSGLYLDHVLHASEHYDVDPLVLKGAVDIEPDTGHWKMFDQVMNVGGNTIESQLVIFDRDPENVFGFFAMLSDRTAFKDGRIDGNTLNFTMMGPVGELEYSAQVEGDSLTGEIAMGLLSFDVTGSRSGGSDIPGTEMPRIEVIRPLTKQEESRILGGEACQWTEFADEVNINSRIWPRTGAIAEKLWSPVELTDNVDDMYRRLNAFAGELSSRGINPESIYEQRLLSLIGEEGYNELKVIMDLMEEVKYHGRMPALMEMDKLYLPEYQLDRLVDIAMPESKAARNFGKLVENGETDAILEALQSWKAAAESLDPYLAGDDKLNDLTTMNSELLLVSEELILRLESGEPSMTDSLLNQKLSMLETGENGLILAVVPSLRKLKSDL